MTLFDDVNKKISELFRMEKEQEGELSPRIKELQTILSSFSTILGNQDKIIESNTKKINRTVNSLSGEKCRFAEKKTVVQMVEDLGMYDKFVIPELRKEHSDLWQFVQTMQDHVMKLENFAEKLSELGIENVKYIKGKEPIELHTFKIPVKVEDAIAEAKERDEVRKLTKRKGLKLK